MGVDDYDCVLGKHLGQQKGNPERFSVNNFLQPKKGGSLIAIFKSYHFESFLRWGVNGLSSIQLAKTRPKPTGGFRWSFWSSWTSTRLICHGTLEVCCPQLHFSIIVLTHFFSVKNPHIENDENGESWHFLQWWMKLSLGGFFGVIFGSSRLFFPEFIVCRVAHSTNPASICSFACPYVLDKRVVDPSVRPGK